MADVDWLNEWSRELRKQHELVFDYATQTLKKEAAEYTGCPVCSSSSAKPYCTKDWFKYWRCGECSMVYLNPRLNDAATFRFYNSAANAAYNRSKFETESDSHSADDKANLANLEWIDTHRGGAKGNLLEIGSASGFFLDKARDRGYCVHGLELNERNWRLSRDRLGDTMLNVDLMEARYPAGTFDVIYMRDVIAHVLRPREFLAECFRIAKPGCIFFIDTHNIDGFLNSVAKGHHTAVFGFMEPHHWSLRTLEKALANAGFRIKDAQFQSSDSTVREALGYLCYPTFTTLFQSGLRWPWSPILRKVHALMAWPPLRKLDERVTPALANKLKRGSVIRVLAEKPLHHG